MLRRLHHEQPASFAFTPANQAWAEGQISKYPEGRQASAIIPLLWRAQEQEGPQDERREPGRHVEHGDGRQRHDRGDGDLRVEARPGAHRVPSAADRRSTWAVRPLVRW